MPGLAENGGFISTTVGRASAKRSAMVSALWRVTAVPGNNPARSPGADGGDLVEVEAAGGVLAERALRHHRQHAGAGAGFQHGVGGPNGGGSERRIGERERRRELLEADLLLGTLRVGGLQRRDGGQHREHGAGAVRTGAGAPAHGAPVALDEQHHGSLGRLVGVLPHPGAFGVARAAGAGHGVAQRRRVEGPAGFERGEQAPGGVEERGGAVRGARRRGAGCGGYGGELRARGRTRRRMGVEHGVLRIGNAWDRRPAARGSRPRHRLAGPAPGRLPRLGAARTGGGRTQAVAAPGRAAVRARRGAMGRVCAAGLSRPPCRG